MGDLSKFSIEDLQALKSGDLSRVSTSGLRMLKATSSASERVENDAISRGAREVANEGVLPEWLAGKPSATLPERIASAPGTRFAVGAASPFLGAAQLLGNAAGQGDNPENLFNNQRIQQFDQMKQAGGATGPDLMGLAGTILSPAALRAMQISPAASVGGRIAQGSGISAGFGATTPVINGGENFWSDKGGQTFGSLLMGGALSGGVEVGRGALGIAKNAFEPLTKSGREQILNRYQQGLAGDKGAQMAAALRGAPEIVPGSQPTASQAMSAIPESTGLAAHQQAISKSDLVSPMFARRAADQQNARAAMIQAGAGTDDAMNAALANRAGNATEGYEPLMARQITPDSQAGIMENAIAGRFASRADALQTQGKMATDAAQATTTAQRQLPKGLDVEDIRQFPILGRDSPQIPRLADRAAEATTAAREMDGIIQRRVKEESFLSGVMESLKNTLGLGTKSLDDFTSRPSFRAALAEAEMSAAEAGRAFPKKAGDKFTVQDMQAVKEFLDESIKKKVGLGLTESDRSVRDIAGTRDQFVKWLSEKVPEWRDARLQYAEDSIPINQMQTMRELGKRLTDATGKETPSTFLRAIDDRTPEAAARLLKKSTGFTRYDNLPQAIGPKNAEAVQAVSDDLTRTLQADRNASATNVSNPMGLAQQSEGSLPNLLSRPAMITNWIMKKLGEGADEKIVKMAAERYLNPKQLADALEAAKATTRSGMMANQLRQGAVIGGASAAAQGVQ